MNRRVFWITGIDLFVLLLILMAAPQDNILATIGSSILVLTCMTAIIGYGVPQMPKPKSNEIMTAIVLSVPYLTILMTGASGLDQLPTFLLWYAIPAFLINLSNKTQSKVGSVILLLVGSSLLWIGFDHRITKNLFEGYTDSYLFNSLWIAAVGLTSCNGQILTSHPFDRGIFPSKEGAKIANITTPLASIIIIPFGLLTGFLQWNPQIDISFFFIGFVGIFLTIALQEELIFRGIALRTLDDLAGEMKSVKHINLIVVSAIFSLTHWNNETDRYVWHYFFAAFVAGIAYAISYRKGGMFAAMFSHTLVDWFWVLFFKRPS